MVQALGMRGAVIDRWQRAARPVAARPARLLGDRIGAFSTLSKTFRFFLQSAMLGLGAYAGAAQAR